MSGSLLDLMGDTGQKPQDVAADKSDAPVKTEHIELDLVLHYDNEARGELLVSLDGREAAAVWLKKSDIQFKDTQRTAPAWTTQGKALTKELPVISVNIPEQLAKEKGLI